MSPRENFNPAFLAASMISADVAPGMERMKSDGVPLDIGRPFLFDGPAFAGAATVVTFWLVAALATDGFVAFALP